MKQIILADGTAFDIKNAQKVFSYDRNFEPPKQKNIFSLDIDKSFTTTFEVVKSKFESANEIEFKIVDEDFSSENFSNYILWTIAEPIAKDSDIIHIEFMEQKGE